MSPPRPRYTRINTRVQQLLLQANVQHAPVPVEEIANRAGAKVVFNDFNQEISGLLVRRPGEVVIGVDSRQPSTDRIKPTARQRFTIAHELGHLVLHEGEEVHVDKDFRVNLRSSSSATAENVEEIEANAFAASLLMPMKFLLNDLQQNGVDLENEEQILGLATRYGVSMQAMTYRLINAFRLR